MANGLRLGDWKLKGKLGEGVIVLASASDGKVNLVAMATDDAMAHGAHAGNLIKSIAGKSRRRRWWTSEHGAGRR